MLALPAALCPVVRLLPSVPAMTGEVLATASGAADGGGVFCLIVAIAIVLAGVFKAKGPPPS